MSALFKKSLLMMVLLFATVAVATSVYSGWNLHAALTEEYRSKGVAIAKNIADSSVEVIMNRDASMAQSMIDQYSEIQGVNYIYIVDGRGEVISHTFVPQVPAEVMILKSSTRGVRVTHVEIPALGSIMDIAFPILAGVAGSVHVGMDMDLIRARIVSALGRQLALVAVIFLVSIAVAYAFMARISRPLNDLTGYAARLAEKEFDAELPVRSSDEIGLLAATMQNMARDLNRSYEELEARVRERTAELMVAKDTAEQSLAKLQVAQKRLVESEKMAALGTLVAGIAHEINTPVGVSITAASHLQEKLGELSESYRAGTIKKTELEKFIETSGETVRITMANLHRASELISSFKQVAVDQSSEDRRQFSLKAYLEEVLLSLKHEYKRTKHRIEVLGDAQLVVDSYPGALSQIATNFLMNSLMHAYGPDDAGRIVFEVRRHDGCAILTYSDDGRGITAEHLPRIFDPFFTTRRGTGGSGLGMHIVYNLVTAKLNGTIACESQPGKGVTFTVTFPLRAGEPT